MIADGFQPQNVRWRMVRDALAHAVWPRGDATGGASRRNATFPWLFCVIEAELMCAVRVSGEPCLTLAATCGTVVSSSLGLARLPQ